MTPNPHQKPRLYIDLSADRARRQAADQVRIADEANFWRRDAWGYPRMFSRLKGEWGEMLRKAMESTFASGNTKYQAEAKGPTIQVRGFRWVQIEEKIPAGCNPLRDLKPHLSLLYRPPPGRPVIDVEGDADTDALRWLMSYANFNEACIRRQDWTVGRQVAAIRPTLRRFDEDEFYPTSLKVLGAHECWAIEDPNRQGCAAVFGEILKSGHHLIWDVSDPRNPYWGEWVSAKSWQRGGRPVWYMGANNGSAYPWRWRRSPLMPAIIHRWDLLSDVLLPARLTDVESIKELVLARAWLAVVEQAGSFNKMVITSEREMGGLAQTMLDPTVITALFGDGAAKLSVVPHSLDAVKILWELYEARVLEWARRYNPGFEVERGAKAESGYALNLRMTGKYLLRQQQAARAMPLDTELLKATIATHNYLGASQQCGLRVWDGEVYWTPGEGVFDRRLLIPEVTPNITYPHIWRPEERKEVRDELQRAVDQHLESPRALYLFDRNLEGDRPDGDNWRDADQHIRESLADCTAYAALGYGQNWEKLGDVARATPVAEEDGHIPPAEVARVAAHGLELREDHKGRFGGLKAKHLLARGRKLAKRAPFLGGELRMLQAWLAAHATDQQADQGEGEWGSDDNPSGLYLQWLSQGGDEALAWVSGILNEGGEA